MKMLKCHLILVIWTAGLAKGDDDYENKLTKLWSLSSASNSDGSAVLNVTSASIVIQPTSFDTTARTSRETKLPLVYKKFAFKPRAIPLRREEPRQNNYYTQDNMSKYKSDVLFPGNYIPIAKEKSDDVKDSPLEERFQPKAIPLLRGEMFQKRSLDVDEEPIIEKPSGFSEAVAQRRSISDYLAVEEDEDDEGEFDDEDEDEEYLEKDQKGHVHTSHADKYKRKAVKKAGKKMTKYMLPLLLAYKLKYFALVPLLIGGLILLVGATGLAGFFFALFAAVMGLQKGGY